jgi:hypothetical protein
MHVHIPVKISKNGASTLSLRISMLSTAMKQCGGMWQSIIRGHISLKVKRLNRWLVWLVRGLSACTYLDMMCTFDTIMKDRNLQTFFDVAHSGTVIAVNCMFYYISTQVVTKVMLYSFFNRGTLYLKVRNKWN